MAVPSLFPLSPLYVQYTVRTYWCNNNEKKIGHSLFSDRHSIRNCSKFYGKLRHASEERRGSPTKVGGAASPHARTECCWCGLGSSENGACTMGVCVYNNLGGEISQLMTRMEAFIALAPRAASWGISFFFLGGGRGKRERVLENP